jgi:hypothetical protein
MHNTCYHFGKFQLATCNSLVRLTFFSLNDLIRCSWTYLWRIHVTCSIWNLDYTNLFSVEHFQEIHKKMTSFALEIKGAWVLIILLLSVSEVIKLDFYYLLTSWSNLPDIFSRCHRWTLASQNGFRTMWRDDLVVVCELKEKNLATFLFDNRCKLRGKPTSWRCSNIMSSCSGNPMMTHVSPWQGTNSAQQRGHESNATSWDHTMRHLSIHAMLSGVI